MTNDRDVPFIYLASASPRRRELLTQLGLICHSIPTNVDESQRDAESANSYVSRLALAKARAAKAKLSDSSVPILAADTAVVLGKQIFGKPGNQGAARQMLADFSGRGHDVYSAVAVLCGESEHISVSHSRVYFREISDTEIDEYWRTGEPRDKAGGYAIQGKGAIFVTRLEGSYSGVMGLPLYETSQLLQSCGWSFWKS